MGLGYPQPLLGNLSQVGPNFPHLRDKFGIGTSPGKADPHKIPTLKRRKMEAP